METEVIVISDKKTNSLFVVEVTMGCGQTMLSKFCRVGAVPSVSARFDFPEKVGFCELI